MALAAVKDPVSPPPTQKKKKKRERKCNTDLGATVSILLHTETDKCWVSHFDQDVVHTVHMYELNPPPLHVVQDALVAQGSVQTPVPI